MAGIYSQGGSAGHRYAGWLETVEAKNFQFGGKVFNGSPSAIYVGSNLVWPWLTIVTKQAILGAFGQTDGMAVINATNAYLTGIAASGQAGKDKATALADYINNTNPIGGAMLCWYGSDGLAFCLDGQVKGDTAGAWTDCMGGRIYTNYGATEITKGWNFGGSAKMVHTGGVIYPGATSTIEFVVRRTRVQAEIIFAAGGASNDDSLWMVYRGGTQMHFRNNGNYYGYTDLQQTGYRTTSLNVNYGVDNFIDLQSNNIVGGAIGTTADSVIASRNTGSTLYFNGDIMAIRIYNRLLTKEEMLAHQRLDNERFNLGLTPSTP